MAAIFTYMRQTLVIPMHCGDDEKSKTRLNLTPLRGWVPWLKIISIYCLSLPVRVAQQKNVMALFDRSKKFCLHYT